MYYSTLYLKVLLLYFGYNKYLLLFSRRQYHDPLDVETMTKLTQKRFSPETNKKIRWVTGMYHDWRNYRNSNVHVMNIYCDLDNVENLRKEELIPAVCRFLTEVCKLDGSQFPGKTLYDIVICLQFHLETMGFSWKFLSEESFRDIRFTLDNLMKEHCKEGVGAKVNKAQILTKFQEEVLWSLGLLGCHNPSTLLNTVVFVIGKGMAL